MPVERDSEVYNMNHPRRGIAIIFNHMNFDPRLGLKQRNGTNVDRDSLRSVLKGLDFEVKVYNDLYFKVCCLLVFSRKKMTLSQLSLSARNIWPCPAVRMRAS